MRRKPRAKRYRKRLRLHFGKDEPQHPGVTGNISIGGISIHSAVPLPKGARVVIRCQMPDDAATLILKGNVRWARRVQLQIGMAPQSRMGVMFEELPPQAYLDLLARLEEQLGESGRPVEGVSVDGDDDGGVEPDTRGDDPDEATIDDAIVDRPPSKSEVAEARSSRDRTTVPFMEPIPNVQARRAPLVGTQLPQGRPVSVADTRPPAATPHRLERMPETLPPGIVKSMDTQPPMQPVTMPPSPAVPAVPSPDFPVPPLGANARITTVVDEQHLAFPDAGSSPLAPTSAIEIFMQVTAKLLEGTAPSNTRLLMHRCSLAVSHTLPVSEGSALVTTVKVVQVDTAKKQLHLEAMIFDEEMQVGLGKYVVILLPPEPAE